jgi:hypothetical protein
MPFLLGFVIVAILAGAGLLWLHLRGNASSGAGATTPAPHTASTSASSGTSPSPAVAGPAGVVKQFYRDINAHNYAAAYVLEPAIHHYKTFAQFKAGYGDTTHDTVMITGVSGDVVSVYLSAEHTDGSIHTFSGTYTVRGGKIVAANIS